MKNKHEKQPSDYPSDSNRDHLVRFDVNHNKMNHEDLLNVFKHMIKIGGYVTHHDEDELVFVKIKL